MNKEDLKIVFLGTPEFAVPSLDRLVTGGYDVAGVVTMPDKPAGRGHRMLQSPVKQYALEHGLRLMQPANLKDPEFVDGLRGLGANLFIVIAFRMLPEVVWRMPALGTFNLHASLLPRYRGAAPINRAVMNGDTVTGVTTFMLRHEIDTGDILRQVRVPIADDDCVGDVHDRLMYIGADLTLDTVEHIVAGDLTPQPQDELLQGETPTPAPKIFAEDCTIDWSRPARVIYNQVRGLSPYPAARTYDADGRMYKIYSTRLTGLAAREPGRVTASDGRLYVSAADVQLEVTSLQSAGKRRMDADAWLRGVKDVPAIFTKPDVEQ